MTDYTRDDVIEALEYLLSPVCTETQFDYCDEIRAAIALLKAQEPRVIELSEITPHFKQFEENANLSADVIESDAGDNTILFVYPKDEEKESSDD